MISGDETQQLNAEPDIVPGPISDASSSGKKRLDPDDDSDRTSNKRLHVSDSPEPQPSCRTCNTSDHTTEDCQISSASKKKSVHDPVSKTTALGARRVSVSTLAKIPLQINGKELKAVFDSGSELSIIRESVATPIIGKRTLVNTLLCGNGKSRIASQMILETICIVDKRVLKIQFYVVPDKMTTSDITIGMNLLVNKPALIVKVTAKGARLVNKPELKNVGTSNPLLELAFDDETSNEELKQLRTLVCKYEHLFPDGFMKRSAMLQSIKEQAKLNQP